MNPSDYFRSQSKKLHRLLKNGDHHAIDRYCNVYRDVDQISLMRSQHTVAKEHGFDSWECMLRAPEQKIQLAALMGREPQLCVWGYRTYKSTKRVPREEQDQEFQENRKLLLKNWELTGRVTKWLVENVSPIKTVNRQAHSYHLKHLAEEIMGEYVPNGVLIAAALMSGFKCSNPEFGHPNISFAISQRSVNFLRIKRKEIHLTSLVNTMVQ